MQQGQSRDDGGSCTACASILVYNMQNAELGCLADFVAVQSQDGGAIDGPGVASCAAWCGNFSIQYADYRAVLLVDFVVVQSKDRRLGLDQRSESAASTARHPTHRHPHQPTRKQNAHSSTRSPVAGAHRQLTAAKLPTGDSHENMSMHNNSGAKTSQSCLVTNKLITSSTH